MEGNDFDNEQKAETEVYKGSDITGFPFIYISVSIQLFFMCTINLCINTEKYQKHFYSISRRWRSSFILYFN